MRLALHNGTPLAFSFDPRRLSLFKLSRSLKEKKIQNPTAGTAFGRNMTIWIIERPSTSDGRAEIEGRLVLTRAFRTHTCCGPPLVDAWRIRTARLPGERAPRRTTTTTTAMRNRSQFTKELRTRTEYRPFDIPAIIGTGECSADHPADREPGHVCVVL